jgi:hypothetical protein
MTGADVIREPAAVQVPANPKRHPDPFDIVVLRADDSAQTVWAEQDVVGRASGLTVDRMNWIVDRSRREREAIDGRT